VTLDPGSHVITHLEAAEDHTAVHGARAH
jgi:hypothetical protein